MVCTNDFCLDIYIYYMFIHIENYDNIPVTFTSTTSIDKYQYHVPIYL